jgi:hypothetical protein
LAAAAAAAANFNGGTVYIPDPNPNAFSLTINGLVNFNGISASGNNMVNLLVAGDMAVNQPLVLRNSMEIKGAGKRNTSFMYKGGSWVTGTSSPLIYIPFRNSIHLENLYLEMNSGPYGSALYADGDAGGNGSNGIILDNVAFDGFNGGGIARPAVFKGGFDYLMRDVTCTTGNIAGNTAPSPCMEFTNSSKATFNGSTQVPGRVIIERAFFGNSGISVNAAPNPGATPGDYNINGVLTENTYTPFLSIRPGLDLAARFYLTDIITADQASGPGTPMIQTSGNRINTISVSGGSLQQNQPVLITDQTSPGLLITKMNIATTNYGYNNPHFAFNDSFTEISGQPLNLVNGSRALIPIVGVGAPSGCVVSAGGAVPIGPVSYVLTAIDALGIESLGGPSVSATTTTGNQTVTCNVPTLPAGAIGYSIYRNTGGSFNRAGIAPCTNGVPQVRTGTFVDNVAIPCGAALPNFNGAGSSLLSSSGLATFQNQAVSPTGFIATQTAPSLTAARTQTIPDASGTYILDSTLLENLKKTGGQSVPERAILTGTYTNATTRASNVNGLSFTVSASRNYTAVCHLYYQGSGRTAGLDVTITGPASPISVFYSYDEGARTTPTNSVASAFYTKLTGSSTIIAKTNLHATVTIGLRNGANAGTVQVQGSATGTGTVMVQAGSFCMVQ